MTEYFIGTGGWSYFKIPNQPSLKAYSECFNYVEVNNTFYKYPTIRTAERWRRIVPSNFEFTVRCHQDLTHRIGLKATDQAYAVFSKMIGVCRVLDASFLHLLTPPSYGVDDAEIRQARAFFSTINLKGIRLAWEARCPMTPKLSKLMRDFGVVHSVDLSRGTPPWKSDVVYTRLFGRGEHNVYQFSDEELTEIDQKIVKSEAKTAIVTYHGLRMSTDALRYKAYKETGTFLPITEFVGAESAKAVIQEDAAFPSTRAELVKHQGWKVVDLTIDKRIHLSDLLSKIPDKIYNTVQEVVRELEVIL